MKKPLQKLARYDDVFRFFLKCSPLVLLWAAIPALVWGQNIWRDAAALLLLLIVCGTGARLAFLRSRPKVLLCKGAHLKPAHESYAEIDALLTEMEIPYYE